MEYQQEMLVSLFFQHLFCIPCPGGSLCLGGRMETPPHQPRNPELPVRWDGVMGIAPSNVLQDYAALHQCHLTSHVAWRAIASS